MPAPAQPFPVEELVETFRSKLSKYPDSAPAHYNLGRTHYFAYALRSDTIHAYDHGSLPSVHGTQYPPSNHLPQLRMTRENSDTLPDQVLLEHLRKGVKHQYQAVKLDPKAAYHVGLASVLEEGSRQANQIDTRLLPGSLEAVTIPDSVKKKSSPEYWLVLAAEHYWKAFHKTIDQDRRRPYQPALGLNTLISHEAAKGFLRVAGKLDMENRWAKLVREVKQGEKDLKQLSREVVTPIIFSLQPGNSLKELIDSNVTVRFDLDGIGRSQRWQWVEPRTGILVWDPKRSGKITSGRQLFGNVTWWFFWENGYEPLAVLDVDDNGWLKKQELNRLSVWFDRNQDGKTQAGEVSPVKTVGIKAISVQPTGKFNGVLTAKPGIKLQNGQTLPTWDWKATLLGR
ncbi:MAG: hypothetical protein ABEJ65_00310 [bacterium]